MANSKGYHSMYLIDTNLYNHFQNIKNQAEANLSDNVSSSNNLVKNSVSETKETESKTKIVKFDNGFKETVISEPMGENYDINIDPTKIKPPNTGFKTVNENNTSQIKPVLTEEMDLNNTEAEQTFSKDHQLNKIESFDRPSNFQFNALPVNDLNMKSITNSDKQNEKEITDEIKNISEDNLSQQPEISNGPLVPPITSESNLSLPETNKNVKKKVAKPTLRIKYNENQKANKLREKNLKKRKNKREKLFNKNRTLDEIKDNSKVEENKSNFKTLIQTANKIKKKYANKKKSSLQNKIIKKIKEQQKEMENNEKLKVQNDSNSYDLIKDISPSSKRPRYLKKENEVKYNHDKKSKNLNYSLY